MKKNLIAFLLDVALTVPAFASATVSDITIRQRWPFSGKVDIDFALAGEDAVALDYFIKYDGIEQWVKIDSSALTGDVKSAKVGSCHAVWDPAASGLGEETLTGFAVKIDVVSFSDRKYLVVDIRNGTYGYMSEPPANGWTAADGYMSSKMVFRRVPAGTYTIGHPKADLAPFYGGNSGWWPQHMANMGQRQVTISSDYYIAVYPTTMGQMYHIHGYSDHHEQSVYNKYNYQNLRGDKNWPTDKFSVTASSEAGLFRNRLGGELLIDLPTVSQYEVAMRAGTTTIFPNGGSGSESLADLKSNYYLKLSTDQSENVGLRDPNGWGVYNPIGMCWYVVLDAVSASQDRETTTGQKFINFAESGTDPIGHTVTDASDRLRMAMGGGWYVGNWTTMSGFRMATTESATSGAARFCIHLDSTIAD